MKTQYVVGFMFSSQLERVALIRKQKPAWQHGKLNGIGGKIEDGEMSLATMVREFKEETGFITSPLQWGRFCEMSGGQNDDGGEFSVDFFATTGNLVSLTSPEDEKVEIVYIADVYPSRIDMIENLPWLIALALDYLQDGRPALVIAKYP